MALADAAPPTSLRERAIRGTAFSVLGKITAQTLRLGSNLLLTRLLFPEAFGLMAIVNMLVMGLEMTSDLGTRISIIQSARGEETSFLNTAWTLEVIRGAVLTAIGSLAGIPLALIYDQPDLMFLTPLATVSALIGGFTSTKLASLHRKLNLGRVILNDLTWQTASVLVMLGYAYAFRSVWALIAGPIVGSVIRVLLSHFALPGPLNRFEWERDSVRAIFSLGKWIFVSTLITFLATRFDILLLGKLIALDKLGIYSIASILATLPMTLGGQVIGTVLLPALAASYREDHSALVASFNRARKVILPAGFMVTLGTATLASPFFELLYDERYRDAGWIAQLLMLSCWFVFLQEAYSRVLQAIGDARPLAIANATKLVMTAAGGLSGFALYDLPGFIIGSALGPLASFAVLIGTLSKKGLHAGKTELQYTVAGVTLSALAHGLSFAMTQRAAIAPAIASLSAGSAIALCVALWAGKRVLREARA